MFSLILTSTYLYLTYMFLFFIPVHYYNYNGNCWNAPMFPVPRFASEYGYQSYPSYITLSQASSPNQLVWNSSLMFSRQHHQNGMYWIFAFIRVSNILQFYSEKTPLRCFYRIYSASK